MEESKNINWGDANTWPIRIDDPEPEIALKRPYWRYPNRKDFFELRGVTCIDWPTREVDLLAKNVNGTLITVARKMTIYEIMRYSPIFQMLKWKILVPLIRILYFLS